MQSCPTSCKEITYCVEPGRIPPDEDADKIAFECSLLNVTKDDEFSPSMLATFKK